MSYCETLDPLDLIFIFGRKCRAPIGVYSEGQVDVYVKLPAGSHLYNTSKSGHLHMMPNCR